MRLVPTSTHIIPSSPLTEGWEDQKLVVEKHEFPALVKSQRKITFVFSHANGFHKEAYHPLLKSVRDHIRGSRMYDSTDIHMIAWDARTHGDSARLNQGKSNPRYRCVDHALDTKQVVDVLELRDCDQLIGVGHSFGACAMILLETFYPRTFDGLCMIEPVMINQFRPIKLVMKSPLFTSINRRDEWADRKECMASLSKRPFWQLLYPEVLENYVEYGMYDTDKGTIKLKSPKEYEHHLYICTNADAVTTFNSTKLLQIPAHFVFANQSFLQDVQTIESMVQSNPTRITAEFVEGTHMVPCEVPDEMAPHIMKSVERLAANGGNTNHSKL